MDLHTLDSDVHRGAHADDDFDAWADILAHFDAKPAGRHVLADADLDDEQRADLDADFHAVIDGDTDSYVHGTFPWWRELYVDPDQYSGGTGLLEGWDAIKPRSRGRRVVDRVAGWFRPRVHRV